MILNTRARWIILSMATLIITGCGREGIVYPKAKVEPVTETLHGVTITDNYRWLEDSEAPEVQAWFQKQNELTLPLLRRFPEHAQILAQLQELYNIPSLIFPGPHGNRYFYWQRQPGQNHSVLYMAKGGWDAEPKVLLDPNTWSEDGSVSCGFTMATRDGTLLIYGKVQSGNENPTMYILNTDTGEHLPDVSPFTRSSPNAWLPDKSGFFYTRNPDPGTVPAGDEFYFPKIYLHTLGTDWNDDELIWGEGKPKGYLCWLGLGLDERHVFITSTIDWTKNDVHVFDLEDPTREIKTVVEGYDGNFNFTAFEGSFYFETTWNAPHRVIYKCPADDPRQENWQVVIPEPENGVLDGWEIINGQLVVKVMENAFSRLFIYSLDGELLKELELPMPGTVGGLSGEWDGHELFYTFSSFAYPDATFRYDMINGTTERIDQLKIEVDLDRFETKQVWYTSKDGTRVPMFITQPKGLVLDGKNPVHLGGYGGFNISIRPGFNRGLLPWFEAGGTFAIPCLRGGGEFGRAWHEGGRRENKQNVYDDFYAAAEYLIAEGYTNPDQLVATGGSNGGLLIGAAITQRPELFRAAICSAPLLDMLRYHLLTVGKIWAGEYGSAENADEFEWLYAYSPYHHVQPGTIFPATLIKTGTSDTRVAPAHALKMAALLQATAGNDPDTRPILLHVQEKTGHGGGRPLDMSLQLMADEQVWIMWQLGMIEEPNTE